MKCIRSLLCLSALALSASGCVAVSAVRVAGDVVEGTANATVFTAKTAGKAAGAVLPGGGDDDEDEGAEK